MISHEHRFIFIHIPRTGGTSLEKAFLGEDLWKTAPAQKHLSARSARRLYGRKAWDGYFKFAFVRNPWDRVVSLWKSGYYAPASSLREFLVRFKPRPHEHPSSRYADILDLKLDFVGRFESLQEDFDRVCDRIGIARRALPHAESGGHEHYSRYYDAETKALVRHVYRRDIERYGYSFADESAVPAAETAPGLACVVRYEIARRAYGLAGLARAGQRRLARRRMDEKH